ncbi:hypothetical protein GCM10010199_38270 [Dactylosporangium roseum]
MRDGRLVTRVGSQHVRGRVGRAPVSPEPHGERGDAVQPDRERDKPESAGTGALITIGVLGILLIIGFIFSVTGR